MPATRLTLLIAIATVVMTATACGSDQSALDADATVPSTSTTIGSQPTTSLTPTTSPGTTPATDTTIAAPPTSPAPSPGAGDPTVTCSGDGARTADLDGDGIDDTVVHRFDDSLGSAVLEVCLAGAGGGLRIEGLGQGQMLELIDVTGDGRPEIFYGATAALFRSAQIARVVDGALVTVTTAGGGPLVLVDGYPDGTPPDGARRAFGCVPGSTGQRLADATVQLAADGSATVTVIAWSLEGGAAVVLDETITSVGDAGGATFEPEVLAAAADELVAEHAPPC